MFRFFDNRAALILGVMSLGTLVPGFVLDCIMFSGLDGVRSYSLPGSIFVLLREGQWLIGITLFLFSMVFPVLKNLAVLAVAASTIPLRVEVRRKIRHVLHVTGKYSMLDVFVLAVLVVAVKLEGMIEARLMPGTVFFLASVVLSLLAGQAVRCDTAECEPQAEPGSEDFPMSNSTPPGRSTDPSLPASLQAGSPAVPEQGPVVAEVVAHGPRGKSLALRLGLLLVFLAGSAMASVGVDMLLAPTDESIDRVELTKGMDFLPSVGELIDTPDYYILLIMHNGTEVETQSYEDKLIGNGIIWTIDPVPLASIAEVMVMDENDLTPDDALDRVTVHGALNEGQLYGVNLMGPPPPSRTPAIVLIVVGGFVAGVLLLRFLILQAI
ncbi:MAG: hypothetical protein D6E12_17515 [Desulfovibrio sp.]|nr:MAG: hypothetical protein D6E12_17515 [Desulfovibrio sp.]